MREALCKAIIPQNTSLSAIYKRYTKVIPYTLPQPARQGMMLSAEILKIWRQKLKRYLYAVLAMLAVVCWTGQFRVAAQAPAHQKHVFTPETIPWGPAPPIIRPGAQFAVLEGDPMASTGDYTIRLKLPDGYRISPHWHPQ